MKQIDQIHKIADLLLQFSNEVKEKGKLRLNDINIIAEDILVPILGIAYNTELENLNKYNGNYPGIDLASNEHLFIGNVKRKIAFQVTSNNSIDKIKKTLEQFIKGDFYNKFDEIYIYNLISKQNKYQNGTIVEINKIVNNKFTFSPHTNIIDRTDIEKIIKTLTPISKIEKICKLLEDQFVYRKKSLLSLEIWETDGRLGFGFSNLLNSIDFTTYNTLIKDGISNDAKEILDILLNKYSDTFSQNYSNEKIDKLKNLGFNTYLKAAFNQSLSSYKIIKDDILISLNISSFRKKLSNTFHISKINIDESDYPLINEPLNHPAIKFIKETVLNIFKDCGLNDDLQNIFIKDFNQNIHECIINTFGKNDYLIHIDSTQDKWIKENENDLLKYTKDLAKLGFVEGEELEYQESYGIWQDIREYGLIEDESSNEFHYSNKIKSNYNENLKKELKLKKVEELIEEYFKSYDTNQEGYLNNILFLIADFGKGKTSFLHHYAAELAKNYLKTNEGLFPIYINLNEYDRYSNSPSLGVFGYYLAKKFKIDIKDSYFKSKNYIFLVDSLDECGELSESNIEKVIKDVIEIQNLDNINRRNNRIIIASRPISKGLKEQITKYKPFILNKVEKETKNLEITENYISIYGFKKEQFDKYIDFALNRFLKNTTISINDFSGFSKVILSRIINKVELNLYYELYDKVLKESELKRPIFAYMIYKLIVSNSNFIDFGKVGVYISFLNQLSRDAKHKDDCNHKVSLKEEFIYRNILHASAILWQYKRNSGEQTFLTKADICRTIEENEIDKNDNKVLKEFHDIDSVHFLSHSYLGEKDNTLHFQHQSFAEILLAEYYLKVFIKYAIEENNTIEEARIRLSIGLPTDQTIEFFKGILSLLKECVSEKPEDKNVKARRELLLPLLASMSINKHNKKLYSTRLNATWFEKHEDKIFLNNKLSKEIIEDFPITKKILDKIELLCQSIIASSKIYFINETSTHTIVYRNELVSVNNKIKIYEIDKWFALIAGNIIATNVKQKQFFNSNINSNHLFNLIHSWNQNFNSFPYWGKDLFMGINMQNNQSNISHSNFKAYGVNFSNSIFKRITFLNSELRGCDFSHSSFEYFNLEYCNISRTRFDDIVIVGSKIEEFDALMPFEGLFSLTFCFIAQGLLFPSILNDILKGTTSGILNQSTDFSIVNIKESAEFIDEYFLPLKGIFSQIIQKERNANTLITAFKFSENIKDLRSINKSKKELISKKFEKFIREIENEEIKKAK